MLKQNLGWIQFVHNGWCWYCVSINTWKTGYPNFGRVGHLKFFCMINIYEMAAIFQFFHNGRCWYSISIDTQKTGDPNFGLVSNMNFFRMINIYEMVTILQFFHNGWHWYSITVNTQKTGYPNFGRRSVIWNFSVQSIFMKWWPFFNLFIMANADILFLLTLGKPEKQSWGGQLSEIFPYNWYLWNGSVDSVFQIFCWFSFPHHPS